MSRVTNFCFFHLTTSSSSLMHSLSRWALRGLCERTPCLPAHWHYQSSQWCRQSSPVKIKAHGSALDPHSLSSCPLCMPPEVGEQRRARSPCLMVVDGKPSRWMGKRRCNYPLVNPLPWAAPLPASLILIHHAGAIGHTHPLSVVALERVTLSIMSNRWACDGRGLAHYPDRQSVASESLKFLASLPNEVLGGEGWELWFAYYMGTRID